MPGQTANFTCIKRPENKISGIVQDSTGNPFVIDENTKLIVKAYKNAINGGFVKKAQVNTDGTFSIEGLDSDLTYQLKFILIQNSEVTTQWIGENNQGVAERSNAIIIDTSISLYFQFTK